MFLNRRHFSFTEVLTPNYPIGCCELNSDFARGKNVKTNLQLMNNNIKFVNSFNYLRRVIENYNL